MSEKYDLVIIVARSAIDDGRETDESLRTSLEYTKLCYEQAYGQITGQYEFHTFAWPSYVELPASGETVQFFARRTETLAITNRQMMVVLNGWDGLTSNGVTFNTLFRHNASRITLRVFADQPRCFYRVNVEQIFQLFDGKIVINPFLNGIPHEPLDEEITAILDHGERQLQYSTALFYRYFRAFGVLKIN
ncbi:uncharacterized protein N7482_001070 [Penicillium canariense]|uniref:Uncharacterized protein n=1 Tax=Penicillium canariense TaxID=189055 RepID=A0A9W9ICL8_9EURO|nr:uncharacterized protein N7482_001070 [Penicillium canariense]KAJ5175193.1 hypothetical protein N7482_001070 [Penicillium canariense]